MTSPEPTSAKRPSPRYCRNCGFRIERAQVPTGRIASGPFWRETWVHSNGADRGKEACMWRAEPKRRGDRTLYEQIRDTRPDEVRCAALAEAAAAIHDADIWEVADALDVIRALRSKAAAQ